MRYIRQKDNPLFIKAYGFVDPGGLGQFDTELFEEAAGELPEGWQPALAQPTLAQKLDTVFMGLPTEIRAQFYLQKAAVKMALDSNDVNAAQYMIENIEVSPSLLSVKIELISVFQNKKPGV